MQGRHYRAIARAFIEQCKRLHHEREMHVDCKGVPHCESRANRNDIIAWGAK